MNTKVDYEKLKLEMRELAPIVSSFPEQLQGGVMRLMLAAYVGNDIGHALSEGTATLPAASQPLTGAGMIENPSMVNNAIAPSSPEQKSPSKKTGKPAKKQAYEHLKTLNTGLPGQVGSLDSYIQKYQPKMNIERNVVFTRYLRDMHSDKAVNLDLIYTCYVNSNAKLPQNLKASIVDTASAIKGYGYLDASDINNITVALKGEGLLQTLAANAAGSSNSNTKAA